MNTTSEKQSAFKIAASCVLAWLVPGAGHFLLGKIGRAAIFFVCIISMFVLGIYMQGELVGPSFSDFFGSLKFFAELGMGLIYFLGRTANIGKGEITAFTFDYGNVFLYGAGLLNMLIVFDAFDIAMGRKH
jgi:TM2 domain-containing membrane protein YozV